MRRSVILGAVVVVPAVALAAAQPAALERVAAGVWEVSGIPGSRVPVRHCVTDMMALAQIEHLNRSCTRTIVSDHGASVVINYDCGSSGFGHSRIDVITPRSLRISTQGISDQLPFGYTVQAHRVGDCVKSPETTRH